MMNDYYLEIFEHFQFQLNEMNDIKITNHQQKLVVLKWLIRLFCGYNIIYNVNYENYNLIV